MIFDSTLLFSDAQAVTTTAASTNVIDLLVSARDIGNGERIPLSIKVGTAFAGLTSLQVSVQTDDAENFSSAVTVVQTAAIAAADLVAGYTFNLAQVPVGVSGRYMRIYYTVSGTATAGTVTAGFVAGVQRNG